MVLIRADAVGPGFRGGYQFVESPVIILSYPFGIGEFVKRRRDPDGRVPLFEIVGKFPMRHEVKSGNVHGTPCVSSPQRARRRPFSTKQAVARSVCELLFGRTAYNIKPPEGGILEKLIGVSACDRQSPNSRRGNPPVRGRIWWPHPRRSC